MTGHEADAIIGLYQRHARAWADDRGTGLREAAWLGHTIWLACRNPALSASAAS